jgi:hypothetical protein
MIALERKRGAWGNMIALEKKKSSCPKNHPVPKIILSNNHPAPKSSCPKIILSQNHPVPKIILSQKSSCPKNHPVPKIILSNNHPAQ